MREWGVIRNHSAFSWLVAALLVPTAVGADDLLIEGATVVTAEGSLRVSVRVRGETVAEIGDLVPGPGERVIDASGHLLLPGGVDPHVHLVAGEGFNIADDFESGTRAALAGGVTTVGHMAFPSVGELPIATLERDSGLAEESAVADVFLHTVISDPTQAAVEQLAALAEVGQTSIKVFMPFEGFEARFGSFLTLLREARDEGIVVAMHCEDENLVAWAVDALTARGRTSLDHYPESRPDLAEVAATQRAITMAEATGASIYLVHVSSARALESVKLAEGDLPIFVETRPLYLHLTDAVYQGPDLGLFIGMPPIRGSPDRDALWQGLADGSIDTIATDHVGYRREQKLDPTQTITQFNAGVNNLQVMLPMLFSEGVNEGRLSLERFVELTSTNAARIFGLYPRKGTIAVGSDADLVIWDPDETRTIRDEDMLSNTGFSIYAGTEATGWPVTVLRRGEVVYAEGRVTARRGSGKVIARKRIGDSTGR
ncbi:MAG: amidohydrolase family protein [Deltaproteobacteria bacterium]|nr:amidohydrolase family protein [Deltaproteobacteria bacterium]